MVDGYISRVKYNRNVSSILCNGWKVAILSRILWHMFFATTTYSIFYKIFLDTLTIILYLKSMNPIRYFSHPGSPGQKQYEALRAFYLEGLPSRVVAERFGYTLASFHALKNKFKRGKLTFQFTQKSGPRDRRLPREVREQIIEWRRQKNLSADQILEVCQIKGIEISVATVERVLRDAGFPKLPRRSQLLIGLTAANTLVPEVAEAVDPAGLTGKSFECDVGGIFLFLPFIEQLHLPQVIREARLPGSKQIPNLNYVLAFLGLKLIGNERISQVNDHNFDAGFGLFAGLNVLPKCTAMSTYSYALEGKHLERCLEGFVAQVDRYHHYRSDAINLDFHAIPHHGDESVLETHWVGTRGRRLKGALTLFGQDCDSRLLLYADADIRRSEAEDQILAFAQFWSKRRGRFRSTLVFDARLTTYENLAKLTGQGIKFITLRRRGANLIAEAEALPADSWKRITIENAKRKYPNPFIHDGLVMLPRYGSQIRQIIMKNTGRDNPTFLITNDFTSTPEQIVRKYTKRWRIENGIAEAVKFFHLNALSSPILVKVHFDVLLTVIADTLYYFLAQRLRGFEECNAQKIFRHFVDTRAKIRVTKEVVRVIFPKRAHTPVLKAARLDQHAKPISWLGGRRVEYAWE